MLAGVIQCVDRHVDHDVIANGSYIRLQKLEVGFELLIMLAI